MPAEVRTASRRRVVATVLVAIAIVAAFLCAVAVWLLRNPDRFIPRVTAAVQKKTGLDIRIRGIGLSLFPLTIYLRGVTIQNPKPFPRGNFLIAPTIDATLQVGPLLHRQVAFRSVVLDHPTIDFISDPDGLWNFQNPSGRKDPPKRQPRFSMGSISSLSIQHGELLGSALIDPADTPGPVLMDVLDFSVKFRQIQLTAPRNRPLATILGTLEAEAARFGDIHLRNLHSGLRILPAQLSFRNFHAKTYRGEASGDFTLDFSGKNTKFNTDLDVSGIGMPYLLREFQGGPPKLTGMMRAKMTLAGDLKHTANPFEDIRGSGTFSIVKGEFPSLSANKSMAEMKRFRHGNAAGLPASAFSRFSGDMEFRSHRIYSRKMDIDFYGIDVNGSGNVEEQSGRLDYRGTATILKKQGFFTNVFAKLFKGANEKNGRLSFPIRLAGTLDKPTFAIAH